jgi:hypothetical protein
MSSAMNSNLANAGSGDYPRGGETPPHVFPFEGSLSMVKQIVIEAETPGDSRTMFRVRIDTNVIARTLAAVQAHLVVGEILDRIALPKPIQSSKKLA